MSEPIKLISPFRGEFGIKLMRHVPAVHAMEGRKAIVCEPGERLLYPSCEAYFDCARADDFSRRDQYAKDMDIEALECDAMNATRAYYPGDTIELVRTDESMPRKYFKPESDWQVTEGPWLDEIVICPRWRNYGAAKNWPWWNRLAWLLNEKRLKNPWDYHPKPVAIGAYDSTDRSVGHALFDETTVMPGYEHCALRVAVHYLLNAKLCISTCAGLAHLAMWCGCPLLLISDGPECKVAPGPVRLGDGTIAHPEYWPIKMDRYRAQNHLGADLMVLPDSWNNPELVCETALAYLEHGVKSCP